MDAEVGGPIFKDRLFFFGSFNPQWNTDYNQFAQYRNPSDFGTAGSCTWRHADRLGNFEVPARVYSYAAKLTVKLSNNHQVEGSVFGDPTYGDSNANGNLAQQTASKTTFDKLQYGTRNVAARYNGTFSPTWLVNASFAWGHNNLNDTPFAPNAYQIVDRVQRIPCDLPGSPNPDCASTLNPLRGTFHPSGSRLLRKYNGQQLRHQRRYFEDLNFLGSHNLTFGYRYDRSHYDGTKLRSGPNIAIDPALVDGFFDPADPSAGASQRGFEGEWHKRGLPIPSRVGSVLASQIRRLAPRRLCSRAVRARNRCCALA